MLQELVGKKVEQKRQNEELRAAYPEDVKAYLEEKYGRKFCVNPKPKSNDGSPFLSRSPIILHVNIEPGKMKRMVMLFGQKCTQCRWKITEFGK